MSEVTSQELWDEATKSPEPAGAIGNIPEGKNVMPGDVAHTSRLLPGGFMGVPVKIDDTLTSPSLADDRPQAPSRRPYQVSCREHGSVHVAHGHHGCHRKLEYLFNTPVYVKEFEDYLAMLVRDYAPRVVRDEGVRRVPGDNIGQFVYVRRIVVDPRLCPRCLGELGDNAWRSERGLFCQRECDEAYALELATAGRDEVWSRDRLNMAHYLQEGNRGHPQCGHAHAPMKMAFSGRPTTSVCRHCLNFARNPGDAAAESARLDEKFMESGEGKPTDPPPNYSEPYTKALAASLAFQDIARKLSPRVYYMRRRGTTHPERPVLLAVAERIFFEERSASPPRVVHPCDCGSLPHWRFCKAWEG